MLQTLHNQLSMIDVEAFGYIDKNLSSTAPQLKVVYDGPLPHDSETFKNVAQQVFVDNVPLDMEEVRLDIIPAVEIVEVSPVQPPLTELACLVKVFYDYYKDVYDHVAFEEEHEDWKVNKALYRAERFFQDTENDAEYYSKKNLPQVDQPWLRMELTWLREKSLDLMEKIKKTLKKIRKFKSTKSEDDENESIIWFDESDDSMFYYEDVNDVNNSYPDKSNNNSPNEADDKSPSQSSSEYYSESDNSSSEGEIHYNLEEPYSSSSEGSHKSPSEKKPRWYKLFEIKNTQDNNNQIKKK